MSDHRVFLVVNPHAGRGRGARLVAPVLAALRAEGEEVEHALTARPGDEARLAGEALSRGFSRVVAVGGDGTWGNVGNALLRSGRNVRLGLIPGGTGSDLARSLGIPARDPRAWARMVRGGRTRTIDVGRIEDRYFLNVAGFGYDIAVLEDTRRVRGLSGSLLYLYCALRQIRRYQGFRAEVAVDGGPPEERELLMLVFPNARVFGGGFRIAPRAELADGQIEMVAFRNMPTGRRLLALARLLRGTHEAAPEVESRRGRAFRLRFPEPPAYETDGEWNQAGSRELLVECVPSALPVLVPA